MQSMRLGQHAKIGIGWTFFTCAGLFSFYLAKVNIEKQRYDNMKSRQRMRFANEGVYEPSSRNFSTTKH